MITAVLDTNVLLDLWVFENADVGPLRTAIEAGHCVPLSSVDTRNELAAVLARAQFAVPLERQQQLQSHWRTVARHIERVFPAPYNCTDRKDQPFIDLAFTAQAQWLITRDKAVLKLARKLRGTGLTIAQPVDFQSNP
jgi:putative PIN family toxin of toxin-antitoxin system